MRVESEKQNYRRRQTLISTHMFLLFLEEFVEKKERNCYVNVRYGFAATKWIMLIRTIATAYINLL